jgi:hypothetical protein
MGSGFFRTHPWSAIPEERAGVTAFKDRLNSLLVIVTRENFQAVTVDVRNKIRKLKGS